MPALAQEPRPWTGGYAGIGAGLDFPRDDREVSALRDNDLDKLFAGWGILEQIKGKSTRYADGAAVMEHVIKGSGNQIGFGAITEIKMYTSKGLTLVGPLPADVQNYTNYEAVVMNGATAGDAARAVLKLLATPAGKAAFVSAGVE